MSGDLELQALLNAVPIATPATGATVLGRLASGEPRRFVADGLGGANTAGPSPLSFVEIAGTAYTLQASDLGKQLVFTNTGFVTLTLPSGLPDGWHCLWLQDNVGRIIFQTASGVVLRNQQNHDSSSGRYSSGSLIVRANAFYLAGSTASA